MIKKKKVLFPNLEAEMARNGETQTYIAELLKSSVPTISRKLSGQTEWTIGDVEVLCEHFNIGYNELFLKNK